MKKQVSYLQKLFYDLWNDENGILTITLPKAEEVKPKTITIKTK